MRAAELNAARDDVVEQAESERRTRPTRDEKHALVLPEIHAASAVWPVEHDLNRDARLFVLLRAEAVRLGLSVRVERARPVANGACGEGEGVAREAGGGSGRIDDSQRMGLENAAGEEDAEADVLACYPAVVTVVDIDLGI